MKVQRVGGQCYTLATFNPGKETWYPLCRRVHWPQGWSGWMQKISPLSGFNPRTIMPVESCCTYYAVHMCSILSQISRSSITEITTVVNVAKFPIVCSKELNPYWWYLHPRGRSLQYRWKPRPTPQYFLHIYSPFVFLEILCFMKGKRTTYWSISREYINFYIQEVVIIFWSVAYVEELVGFFHVLHLWERSLGPPRNSMQVGVL